MNPTSFQVGPGPLNPHLIEYIEDAYPKNILSLYHRSLPFKHFLEDHFSLFKEKLLIPQDYQIILCSSATECWNIIPRSFANQHLVHVYNGGLGKKWFQKTQSAHPHPISQYTFPSEEEFSPKDIDLPCKLLCLVQNETANGTQLRPQSILQIRKHFPDSLIALDASSSLGGILLPWEQGDIWFASVQKCLGLPAGLALMIVSPRAIERALQINERSQYNSFLNLLSHFQKYETPYTPNILLIYLLGRILSHRPPMEIIHQQTLERYHEWIRFFIQHKWTCMVQNPRTHSYTVLSISAQAKWIKSLHQYSEKMGYLLSQGYGVHQNNSLRIANFPEIQEKHIIGLKKELANFSENNPLH
ncbi:MAG: aminotransferase class V-fold PLP-dependent enzyme [Cytophagales bacterium]|nr:aminotransferase class V-fold PLP-dependent enzyme [Cytophagales bacterium]